MVPPERLRHVHHVVTATKSWATGNLDVRALLLVGSYAYGRPKPSSDVDLVVVTADRESLVADTAWVRSVAGDNAVPVRHEDWGPVRERRYRTAAGLDIEFGLTSPAWLEVPVDPGTARVLRDGCRVVHDPYETAARALRSLDLPVRPWAAHDVVTGATSKTWSGDGVAGHAER